jgi:hypothetical protein
MKNLKICLHLIPLLLFGGGWDAQTEDEALFLRRIADFWEEGDYLVAKAQIEEYLSAYPTSSFGDTLRAALGDLLLREKSYSDALGRYTDITNPETAQRSFLNRMQCLYHLGWYATLADDCEQFLKNNPGVDPQQKLQATYFLAIALYQQCLNSGKDLEISQRLAERAHPYFEILLESELSSEVAQAFAHLCCILKDYPKASQIILDQAKKTPEHQEDLLFQAALIQAEYDKDLAIKSFSEIGNSGKEKAKEAMYNCLVLSFDAGHFDQLIASKQQVLKNIPEEKVGLAHLFLGRSFLALKSYPEAVTELQTYLKTAPAVPSDIEKSALLSLLEASFHAENLPSFEEGIGRFSSRFPEDAELAGVQLTFAQLLKKQGKLDEARSVLVKLPPTHQIHFELIQLEYQAKNWDACKQKASAFLDSNLAQKELAAYAWRYLISSLMELGQKQLLIEKLQAVLKTEGLFSETENSDWKFLLAKAFFELAEYPKAADLLKPLVTQEAPFTQKANAKLLLAFVLRDTNHDLGAFSSLAEEALSERANLLDLGPLHSALFNAYLELSLLDKAEEHLFQAFLAKTPIETQNLLWLAERYGESHPERAAPLLDHCIQSTEALPDQQEPLIWKRAKIHQLMGESTAAIGLLEKWVRADSEPSNETKLLLAENLVVLNKQEQALKLFDAILEQTNSLSQETAASASLQRARIRVNQWIAKGADPSDPALQKALVDLKNLTLQRCLAHEPIHLEAALDYIELQARLDPSKELPLLQKTKSDFESDEDLLSKDYHESRRQWPKKNRLYEDYLLLFEAKILCSSEQPPSSQHALRAKAKKILLQILDDRSHPALVQRARSQLEKVFVSDAARTQPKK